MRAISRRTAIGVGLAAMGVGFTTGAWLSGGESYASSAPSPLPEPLSIQVSRRIRLHMIQTGWVSVKAPHRAYDGPASLRIPAIVTSQKWTEWLPVTAFVLEHPEALIVVDTGETAKIADPDYTRCDPGTGWFYRRNLRFSVTAEQEIGAQMAAIGIDPQRVTDVIMTHLHSDHMGGMGSFAQAKFSVSEGAIGGHTGALMCRIPQGLNLAATQLREKQVGVFSRSAQLTSDGAISIVPTPGHARGHQSVIVEDEGTSICIAGDAAFTLNQIKSGQIAGIVEEYAAAQQTLDLLRQQHAALGTIMLPTHDPDNRNRLLALG